MAHSLPGEAYQLAARFHLGTPLKRYRRRSLYPIQFILDGFFLTMLLVFLVNNPLKLAD